MLLVIPTMTYANKVLVMVGSKIIDRAMGIITKGKLAKATMIWRHDHFSVVMSVSFQLPLKCARGNRGLMKGYPLQQPPTPLHIRSSAWMMSRGTSVPHRGLPFLHSGPKISMARQTPKGNVCGSMCLQSQPRDPSCLPPLAGCLVLGVAPRIFPSAVLPEEPGCLPHCGPSQSHHWKSCTSNQVPLVTLPMGTSGGSASGSWKDWILDELNFQGLEDRLKMSKDRPGSCWLEGNTCLPIVTWIWERCPSSNIGLRWLIGCPWKGPTG